MSPSQKTQKKLDSLLTRGPEGSWVARCLQYHFVTQAATLRRLRYEIDRIIVAQLAISAQEGHPPFVGLPPAPPTEHEVLAPDVVQNWVETLELDGEISAFSHRLACQLFEEDRPEMRRAWRLNAAPVLPRVRLALSYQRNGFLEGGTP